MVSFIGTTYTTSLGAQMIMTIPKKVVDALNIKKGQLLQVRITEIKEE